MASGNQGTSMWRKNRNLRITASKARSQYTYYVNPQANWDNTYQEVYHSKFKGNDDTVRGLTNEKIARERYENLCECKVLESCFLVREELPWLGASLDGTAMNEKEFLRNIEIKTVKEGKRLSASELLEMKAVKILDKDGEIKKKTDHYAQMQIGMLLSGLSECDYLVYSVVGNDFVWKKVLFDEQYVFDLVSRLIHVYFDEFLPRIMLDFIQEQ